jgi:hypothetical protein
MSKAWKATGNTQTNVWLLALVIVALTGCQGTLMTYKGAIVREGDLITLTEGPQRGGSYHSPDLAIEYQWMRSRNELQLSGLLKFAPRIQNVYFQIPYFYLSLFLTDGQGKILEDKRIGTPGSSDPSNPIRINEKLLLPPGTEKMAFGYSGQASGSGGGGKDGGGDLPIWQVPIVK